MLNYLKASQGRGGGRKPYIKADHVRVLILDEADNMMMQGSDKDTQQIRDMIMKKVRGKEGGYDVDHV